MESKLLSATTANSELPSKLNDLEPLFERVVSIILGFASIVFFVMLVIGGFKYITAGDDPKAAESAKKTITYAVGGVVLLALAYLIIRFIALFTGFEGLTEFKIFLSK